jgi:hypothetical protein
MAQPYASGPVDVWCGVGAGGAPLFLGHGERAPRIQIVRRYKEVTNDLGGDMVPFDKGYAGETGVVTVTLSRWNESTLAIIQDVATTLTGLGAARGLNGPGEVGTLMVTEGVAYKLWLRFPFSAKAAYANAASGAQPAGYRFLAAFLEGPDDLFDLGPPNARKVGLQFTCMRAFDPAVSNAFGTGLFALYDHSMIALPATFN